ncbi:glycoside hydrolase family 2 protein [Lacibacter sp.]|uniref:glycoside hydrolase family 2 protein n=1 Tax=Lacibacter sp. TaxID=1915409 RepID=UPI002B4B6B37|nr:sugar-binding domain-containing protein [Lacibacter sp.]HLP37665.1 glycoside hydrolase family 2 TIM barrel-domain containing protein [Lacibacter sp.]
MMKVVCFVIVVFCSAAAFSQQWKMADVPLKTVWAEKVDINQVLPEYPRPQMVRERWLNLNGVWDFKSYSAGDKMPLPKKLSDKILVPFAWESALSGIRKQVDSKRAWYRRTFTIPADWGNQNIRLNFGAVDWEATVYINGTAVGTHRGGFDAFSFDITDFLNRNGNNEIVVLVYDPGSDEGIAVGKQENSRFKEPQRYSYCPNSGIWQTVWLEPVPKLSISDIKLVPDVNNEMLTVLVNPSSFQQKTKIEVKAFDNGKEIASVSGTINQAIYVPVKNPKLWNPASPFLYDLKITLTDSTGKSDSATSYFGMRSVGIKPYKNLQRIVLNGEYTFMIGPLDQGYWPDGIFTAPTDEALAWDVAGAKDWGFNMIRKHIKVEPSRWYYWCDKMGILVWQDMPSTFKLRTEAEKIQWETELQQMIKQHWNHPSIVNWIVFNEHWGIYDVERITKMVMDLDPSRLVTCNTGIDAGKPDVDYEVGHIKSNHHYRPPTIPLGSNRRAIVNGEFGAIGYTIENHIWDADGPWVHYNYKGKDSATAEYVRFFKQLQDYAAEGLSAAVYTQWTDVENEMNGLYTYDRKVIKLDKAKVTEINKSLWRKDWMREKYPSSELMKLKVNTGEGF